MSTPPNNTDTPSMLHISSLPHLRCPETVSSIMRSVIMALLPASCLGVYYFGLPAAALIVVCISFSVLTEWFICQFIHHTSPTISDLSAIVSGLLLALSLPPQFPLWAGALGAVFATGIVKALFGGLGNNFMNPALAARAFLAACFPVAMNAFAAPRHGTLSGFDAAIDALSAATPRVTYHDLFLSNQLSLLDLQDVLFNLFIGRVGGAVGATSAAAILFGACYLLYRHIISLRIPLSFLLTLFILNWLFNGTGTLLTSEALIVPTFHLLSGGLLLSVFFMATDPVTSPVTPRARTIFGIGCGLLTFAIRSWGSIPEGTCHAILIMNCLVPLLDHIFRPRVFGRRRSHG